MIATGCSAWVATHNWLFGALDLVGNSRLTWLTVTIMDWPSLDYHGILDGCDSHYMHCTAQLMRRLNFSTV
jgi:hypothetical protein